MNNATPLDSADKLLLFALEVTTKVKSMDVDKLHIYPCGWYEPSPGNAHLIRFGVAIVNRNTLQATQVQSELLCVSDDYFRRLAEGFMEAFKPFLDAELAGRKVTYGRQ